MPVDARTFEVLYAVDEDGWHASVPSVAGCRTWGPSLDVARQGIREALSTCEDVLGTNAMDIARAAVFSETFVGAELAVKLGNVAGASFRVRYREELGRVQRIDGNVHGGTIAAGWKRLAVLTRNDRLGLRFWLLEPGITVNEIAMEPFFVRGRFVETHVNNERGAKQAWEAFAAE